MQTSPAIEYHKTRDFGKKLNATVEFIKENFKPLFRALIYIAGPPIILGSILFSQIFERIMNLGTLAQAGLDPGFNDVFGFIIPGIGGMIFLLIGGTALVAVVYDYMILYEKRGKNISVNDVWQLTKTSFWQVLGRMFLLTLLFLAAYVVVVIIIVAFATASPGLAFIIGLPVGGAFLYCIVPIYLIFIITAYEKVGFGTAIGRCFKLVGGKWWSTFGLIVITSIIQGIISYVFMIPWYVIFILKTLHATDTGAFSFAEPTPLMEVISTISFMFYSVMSYVLYFIPLIAIAFQYFNLIELKESKGLMSKIDAFGTSAQEEDEEEHY
ncbi:MAG: hypothetical protein AAGF85_15160 [Bacteroidota bacterium]